MKIVYNVVSVNNCINILVGVFDESILQKSFETNIDASSQSQISNVNK